MLEGNPPEGLTFDDVLLVPARSGVLPAEADTSTWFTRHIRLNVPITSAAMDTVTESRLAIALARQGGLAVIHRNVSVARQAEEVDKVKRSESGMIVDPVTIRPESTIAEAKELMAKYHISGLPVTNGERLLGIVTNRDLRFEHNTGRPVSEVMTKENLITVPVGTRLEDAERMLQQHRVEKLLVVDGGYLLKGLITVKDIQKKLQYPHAAKDEHGRLRVGAAVGATGDFLERAVELKQRNVDVIVVDTAHGHSERVMAAVRAIKKRLPEAELVAGNVGTYEGARELAQQGVDAVKVGIGPGSICTTRVVTGTGVPQLTAIADCAKAVREFGIPVIGDGGIKYSGDVAKAVAAGASTVMIGSLFAGTDESPGETVLYQGRSFKSYRGMGSLGAMSTGSADRYAQETPQGGASAAGEDASLRDGGGRSKLVPEGVEGRVPYKGPLAALVEQLVGGLRSGMGYCGCGSIEEMQQRARFLRVTSAGLRESHVHDVIITKEAPNYRLE
ncbi:MAG: IMP dehydrogenase [Candidatus Acidoferrales bacterium]